MKKTLLKTIYTLGGFAPFHWAYRNKILILTYHRFSHKPEPNKISKAEFARHLEYLKGHSRVLSLSEITDCLKYQKPWPSRATVITIDDGYRDAYEVAFPLLRKFGFPATLFAVTDFLDRKCWLWTDLMRFVTLNTREESVKIEFKNGDRIESGLGGLQQRLNLADRVNLRLKKLPNVEKNQKIEEIASSLKVQIPILPTAEYAPLSWSEALEMENENLTIESHTVTHPILTNISQTELDYELRTSKMRLESALGKKIEHFCYPNGTFNEAVRKSVEEAGYQSAVTSRYDFNNLKSDCFLLNRIDAPSAIENFAQSVSGFEAVKQEIIR